MDEMKWHWYTFEELPVSALYDYLHLRQQVFIIEQQCIYADLDDNDQLAQHLLGFTPEGHLAACLRLLAPKSKYPEPSIGRIIVAPEQRGKKLGHQLVEAGLKQARQLYPGQPVRIQAQSRLTGFYKQHGFDAHGEPYDEDGMEHIDMLTTS